MPGAGVSYAKRSHMLGQGEVEFFASGSAPCVVAIHGFGGTAAELMPVLEGISRAGYAVDAALLPGHGTSPSELQKSTFEDWVQATLGCRRPSSAHGRPRRGTDS
jgi:esterase/lipase